MRFDTPLDDVFRNHSNVRVLRALHRMPAGLALSGREVGRRAGVTHPTALKALDLLVKVGIVTASKGLAGEQYDLNRSHALADQIAGLFDQEAQITRELLDFMQEQLLEQTGKVKSATVFGSVVWGNSTLTSDIDIAISCPARDLEEVEDALEVVSDAVQRRFGNRLSPLIETGEKSSRPAIWKRIEEEGLMLVRAGKPVVR